jgi:hypothetical protein
MNFVFIADYFSHEILGGGELNNRYFCDLLKERGYTVLEIKSDAVTVDFLKKYKESNIIVGNFMALSRAAVLEIQNSNYKYVIYEHDHKYLKSRNPAFYPNYTAPPSELTNIQFYANAKAVLCQSTLHKEIIEKNLKCCNVINLGGNIWSEDVLSKIEEFSKGEKKDCFSILESQIAHKNTFGAVRYCQNKNKSYELISGDYFSFLQKLSQNDKFIFLPQTPETLSRIVVEARMLGVQVHANSKVGATHEEWFKLKGKKLIDFMREKREDIVSVVVSEFETSQQIKQLDETNFDITVILNCYRRPYNLKMQIEAIRAQTNKPKQIWLWVNAHEDNDSWDYSSLDVDRVFKNDFNWKFYGRFAAALLADTEYVAIFDDDTIPGERWFENCFETMTATEGILGSAGVILNDKYYVKHNRCGWPTQNKETTRVDLVGHAWFFKRDWLQYLWREKPTTWDNGEDIQFSYLAQKYGEIQTYCPPHPPDDKSLHGSILGNELGIDSKATSTDQSVSHQRFFNERDVCVQTALRGGWKTTRNINL